MFLYKNFAIFRQRSVFYTKKLTTAGGGKLIVWQSNIYLNVLLIFILFSLAISLYINKRFRGTKNFYARLFLFFMIVWMAAEYLEHSFTSYSLKIIFSKVSYFGIVSIPVLLLLIALQVSGRTKHINYKTICGLAAFPAVTLILVFTNEFHGLIWKQIYLSETGQLILIKEYNIFFWIFMIYVIIVDVISLILIFKTFSKEKYLQSVAYYYL